MLLPYKNSFNKESPTLNFMVYIQGCQFVGAKIKEYYLIRFVKAMAAKTAALKVPFPP